MLTILRKFELDTTIFPWIFYLGLIFPTFYLITILLGNKCVFVSSEENRKRNKLQNWKNLEILLEIFMLLNDLYSTRWEKVSW